MGTVRAFTLDGFREPVNVTLAPNITKEQLETWPAFQNWKTSLRFNLAAQYGDREYRFNHDSYMLRSIEIQSVDWIGSTRIGSIKLDATITNSSGESLPGVCFLRGGSAAVLMILRPKDTRDQRWVIMTEQPRVPTGSMRFLEIPTGTIDGSMVFGGAAAKAIDNLTGFNLPASELINMTALTFQHSTLRASSMKNVVFLSPGSTDDCMPLFLWEKELDRFEIEDIMDRMIGERRTEETIRLQMVNYEELWREGARDAKTLAAWALYEGLSREGILQQAQRDRKKQLVVEDRSSGSEDEEDTVGGAEDDGYCNKVFKRP